jgi:Na+/H+ antiporter NhaA
MDIARVFVNITIGSALLPVSGILFLKKKNRPLWLLLFICGLSFITDVSNIIYLKLGYSGALINNIYFIISFYLISGLFASFTPHIKRLIAIIGILFALLIFTTIVRWQGIHEYQSILRVAASFVFIFYSGIFCHKFLKDLPVRQPLYYPPIWFVIEYSFYFSMALVLFALSTYFIESLPEKYSEILWVTHAFIALLKNLFLFVGVYFFIYRKTELSYDTPWN